MLRCAPLRRALPCPPSGQEVSGPMKMRKERFTYFRKKLLDKRRQLEEEVGRSALYGKGQEDDSIKDLGDQATTAYTREFLFELGNGDRRLLKEVMIALRKLDEGGFGDCERCGEGIAEKRLEALPFARYCIDCQRLVEQEEKAATG
jgi:DnaK suppressor protein